jgi:hypothetical protein
MFSADARASQARAAAAAAMRGKRPSSNTAVVVATTPNPQSSPTWRVSVPSGKAVRHEQHEEDSKEWPTLPGHSGSPPPIPRPQQLPTTSTAATTTVGKNAVAAAAMAGKAATAAATAALVKRNSMPLTAPALSASSLLPTATVVHAAPAEAPPTATALRSASAANVPRLPRCVPPTERERERVRSPKAPPG